jgi:pimeloyl-ACP methyl ester carboxylesterase
VDACVPTTEQNSVEIRSWGRKILARAASESAIRLLECTHGTDLRPKLSQIQHRTLILHGDADMLVPLSDSEHMASQIPNSHLHVFKGAGHVPTVTRPIEVAQVINQFFS